VDTLLVYIYIYKLNLEFYSFKLFSLKLKFECHLYNGSCFNPNARPIELFLPPSGLPPSLLLLRRHPPSVVPPTSSMSNNGHPPPPDNPQILTRLLLSPPPLLPYAPPPTWSSPSMSGPNPIPWHGAIWARAVRIWFPDMEQSEHERSRDTISVIQFTSLLYYLRYR
jgi:hypothetical protein